MNKPMKYPLLWLLVSQQLFAGTADLTYQYLVPYSGGGSLTIKNNGTEKVTISSLSFTSNATIDGTPWGTLYGWQSTIKTLPNADGITINYTINESPFISIEPSASVVLSYNVTKNYGGPFNPYNAAMNSTDVKVIATDSPNSVTLKIDGVCEGDACKDPDPGKVLLGYYPDWAYWRSPKFTANQLQYTKVNHINYAFSIFDKNGNISLYDPDSDAYNLPILSQARLKYPYLNLSLSFGGWSWASTPPGWSCKTGASPQGPAACFSQLAADPDATDTFVKNAILGLQEVHFNGIDIDWEYPISADDAKNYVTLLTKLRQALDIQGNIDHTHYFLTIASPAGIDKINALTSEQWKTIAANVDSIDVMTYDFHGSWDQGEIGSDFLSAMALDPELDPTYNNPVLGKYNVIDAMKAYTDLGVNPNKLVLGIPVYGRMVNILSQGPYLGLYQPITGTPQGEWDNQQSGFTGMIDYACIVDKTKCGNNYTPPSLTLVKPTSDNLGKYSKTPWGYASQLFISYDDAESAAYKTQWAIDQQFAGVMLWDLTGDFPDTDERSMVNSIYKIFNQLTLGQKVNTVANKAKVLRINRPR